MPSKRIPINPQSSDPHERYMMDSVETKIESRGNGIRTVIANITTIAKQIRLPATHILQYFSYAIGVKSRIDDKNEKYILQGKFSEPEIQKIIYQLIEKWVLCGKCRAPETEMIVKNDKISFTCRGCGTTRSADPKEKIYDYMVTHPPPKNKLNEKEKQSAAKVRMDDIESQFSAAVTIKEEDADEWGADISADAIKERQRKLALKTAAVPEAALGKDDEEEEAAEEEEQKSPVQVLREYMDENKAASNDQIGKEVARIKEEYGLKKKDIICLLFEALFTSKDTFLADITKRASLFKQFMKDKSRAKLEMLILGYTEDFVGIQNPDLIPKLAKVLNTFYDSDYLSEEVCVEWFGKEKSKFVKKAETLQKIKAAAKPFIEWLQNAEEEEEDD